jgi:hypothetical protein
MIRISAMLLALALSAPAAAQVYKCQVNGSTVFQGTPCPDGTGGAHTPERGISRMEGGVDHELAAQTRERVAKEKAEARRQRAAANRRYEARRQQEEQIRAAQRAGIVAEGMSERDAIRQYGRPDSVNISQSGGRSCKHLRWRDPYRTVMVCDGEVRSSYAQDID